MAENGLLVKGSLLLTCFLAAILMSASSLSAETLRFNSSVGMPFTNSENSGFEDLVLKEIFKRIDRDVVIKFVPAERAMLNLDQGLDDGCLSRINGLQSVYSNIRQIPEISLERDFMIFSKNVNFKPNGWDSLEPYNVAFITGWKILEKNIIKAKSITHVKDGKQLFQLLNNGRVDVVIYNRWGGHQILKDLQISSIDALEPPLVTVPHYFYVNKKHEDLVMQLDKALKEIKKDGTYQRIELKTLLPLTAKP